MNGAARLVGAFSAAILLAFAALSLAPAAASDVPGDCRMPFRPAVAIDGATASEAEVQAVHDAVMRFQSQLQVFRACLDDRIVAAEAAGDKAMVRSLTDRFNESVTAETEVVEAFNRELDEFRARGK